jgi:tripartite-type tricarboxylate transporter receptor subunit TctC
VHPSLPVKSVKDLIALAKRRPGELNYGATALGSPNHLAGESLKLLAGIDIVRISYKGGGQVLNALMGGEVHLMFSTATAAIPHVKSGRLKGLAVTSPQPSALVPGMPTMTASGAPGYEWVSLFGVFAPGKTSPAIIKRLNEEIVRALGTADVKQKFLASGSEVVGSSPEEFGAKVQAEIVRVGKLIKEAGIKFD